MSSCKQEMCPMWDGDGCPCATFDLDPDDVPTHGIFTRTTPPIPASEAAEDQETKA